MKFKTDEAKRAFNEYHRIGTTCGDCDKWMKSRQCPREHNVNGMSKGPNSGTPVCDEFVMSRSAGMRKTELATRIQTLREAD